MNEIADKSFAFPGSADYVRREALAYWLKLEPNELISSLSSEMVSTMTNVRAYTNVLVELRAASILEANNRILLAQTVQSTWKSYVTVHVLVDIIYLYDRNWQKRKMMAQDDKLLDQNELRFPDNVPEMYAHELPVWYEKEPEGFLLAFIPVAEPEISRLHALVQSLHNEPGLDQIVLAQVKQNPMTLELIAGGLYTLCSRLREEFFLLSSYTGSRQKR